MRVRMKIAHKLGGTFAALTLVIVALVTVIVSVVVANKLKAEAFKRLNNDLDVTLHTFAYFSNDALKTASMLAENPTLVTDLSQRESARVALVSHHLHGLAQDSIVSVYDREGRVLYDGGDVATLHNPRRHPAALGLALAGEPSKGVCVLPTGALAIEATVPVVRGQTIVGAVRVGTKLDNRFVDQLKGITGIEVGIAEGVEVGIAEGNSLKARWLAQTIELSPGQRVQGEVPTDLVREARQQAEPVRRTVVIGGKEFLAAMAPLYGPLGDFVGTLFVAEPSTPLLQAVQDTVGMIVATALSLGLLGALAVKSLAKAITEPIRQLAQQSHDIAKGHLDRRVEISSGDELEQLSHSFNKMCDALVEMQFRDQNANPLTKLPGNLMIESEVNRRIGAGEGLAVLYLDLDHFKAFNDKYGFEQGDRVLRLTADILKSICGENAPHNATFTGHIGGDDFIVVCRLERAEELCQLVCSEFDRRIKELYPTEDRDRGYIVSVDRQGKRQQFPLCSVSIAWVDNEARAIADFLELSSLAADVKKYAKSLAGSSYARDRRGDRDAAFLKDW
ncbi:MAG: HAMP domain-containing protein [Candidatus Sericytochromatia bacterium]|nr:HAMP domain-containing protein [Candidatus Sericytochromatia bacterium]